MQELRYSQVPSHDLDDRIRTELEATDSRFCALMNQGNVEEAVREVYTSDAIILPPGAEMIEGRDGILGFWREAATALSLEKVSLATVDLRRAGDFIHQIGRATIVAGGQRLEGKYIVLWKQEDGRWKWHIDCWNMDS